MKIELLSLDFHGVQISVQFRLVVVEFTIGIALRPRGDAKKSRPVAAFFVEG
jgi:hypothetical protein